VLLCPFRRAMAVFVKHHIHITFFFCFLAISPHTHTREQATDGTRQEAGRPRLRLLGASVEEMDDGQEMQPKSEDPTYNTRVVDWAIRGAQEASLAAATGTTAASFPYEQPLTVATPESDEYLPPTITPGGGQLQRSSRSSSSSVLLEQMERFLERHPSVADRLRPLSPSFESWSPGRWQGASSNRWRQWVRRSFYVLIVIAFIVVSRSVHQLSVQEKIRRERDEVMLVNRGQIDASSKALRTAVVANAGLMALNIVLAVRGVKIWHLLQRVGFEGWIQSFRRAGGVARVLNLATMPVRQAVRLPFRPLEAMAARAAAREAAAREAARRGPLTWSLKKAAGVAEYAERNVWSAVSKIDQKVRGGLG
jgi:hypothetical protein